MSLHGGGFVTAVSKAGNRNRRDLSKVLTERPAGAQSNPLPQ